MKLTMADLRHGQDHHGFDRVSVLRQARRRPTQLASSAFGSVQLRSLRAR